MQEGRIVKTYGQTIMEDILPFYLAIGVSEEKFMDSCPIELRPYEKAYHLKQKEQNNMMFFQGIYIRDALASAWSERAKYPDKPYPFFEKTKDKKQENPEAKELLAATEWACYAHALRRQGLQETD